MHDGYHAVMQRNRVNGGITSALVERYRSFLRPGRKTSDMFILACISTFFLIVLGSLFSGIILNALGLPRSIDENVMTQIVNGQTTAEEAMGAPAYLVWAARCCCLRLCAFAWSFTRRSTA